MCKYVIIIWVGLELICTSVTQSLTGVPRRRIEDLVIGCNSVLQPLSRRLYRVDAMPAIQIRLFAIHMLRLSSNLGRCALGVSIAALSNPEERPLRRR